MTSNRSRSVFLSFGLLAAFGGVIAGCSQKSPGGPTIGATSSAIRVFDPGTPEDGAGCSWSAPTPSATTWHVNASTIPALAAAYQWTDDVVAGFTESSRLNLDFDLAHELDSTSNGGTEQRGWMIARATIPVATTLVRDPVAITDQFDFNFYALFRTDSTGTVTTNDVDDANFYTDGDTPASNPGNSTFRVGFYRPYSATVLAEPGACLAQSISFTCAAICTIASCDCSQTEPDQIPAMLLGVYASLHAANATVAIGDPPGQNRL